jgi:hypothetical protein
MKTQYVYEIRIICGSLSDAKKVHKLIPNDGSTKHLFIKRKRCLPINKDEIEDENDWELVKDLFASNVGDVGG